MRTAGIVLAALALLLPGCADRSGVADRPVPRGPVILPPAARGPVSAALGRSDPRYRLSRAVAGNPAQRFTTSFGRDGVTISAGAGAVRIATRAIGRAQGMRLLAPVAPRTTANRALYNRGGGIREWWSNGPFGLEQGFDLARRPRGTGPLVLQLAVSQHAALHDGTLALPGGLHYGGLHAFDARGRSVSASMALDGPRLKLSIRDRRARYPLRIDPFVQQAKLTGDARSAAGFSVAISGDTIVVGAPGADSDHGAAFVFVKPPAGWADAHETATLTASDGQPNDFLGSSVAIDGDTIVAGAPNHAEGLSTLQGGVYVFVKPPGGWVDGHETAELTINDGFGADSLGWSVGIDGNTIVAGAPNHRPGAAARAQGAAEVFVKPPGGWVTNGNQTAELSPNDIAAGDEFGEAVAISGDTVAVGAPPHEEGASVGQGGVYVFSKPAGGWTTTHTQTAELTINDGFGNDRLGSAVAIDGNALVAGAPGHPASAGGPQVGAAYVFLKPAGGWQATGSQNVELQASDARDAGALGVSVAIAGNTIVAGASGLADYVFVMPAGGWTSVATETAKITSSPPAVSGFGFAVAADGDTVISSDSNRDATYVFTRPAPSATIDAPSDGAKFTQHQSITAAYSCSDQPDGSGLASCTGTVPNGALIDTETVGTHSFAVTATDRAGASRTQTVSYSVVPRAQIEIATPARAETFALGARVLADYTCQFATACAGTVANGSPIDTSTSGTHTFEVTAVDTAGTTSTRTVDYAVAPGAPRLTNVRQSHHRWRRGRASARIAPGHGHVPTGTTFSFVIDQPATVTFNFARLRHDHARTAGRLRLRAHTGTNRVRFTGMLSRERTLSPGRYRLTITATTAEGERSAAHRLRFSIVR